MENGNSSEDTASERSRWTRMSALDLFISGLPLRRYAAPVAGCLYNPSLALLVWRIPAKLLVSSLEDSCRAAGVQPMLEARGSQRKPVQ